MAEHVLHSVAPSFMWNLLGLFKFFNKQTNIKRRLHTRSDFYLQCSCEVSQFQHPMNGRMTSKTTKKSSHKFLFRLSLLQKDRISTATILQDAKIKEWIRVNNKIETKQFNDCRPSDRVAFFPFSRNFAIKCVTKNQHRDFFIYFQV